MAQDCIKLALSCGGDFEEALRDVMDKYEESTILCTSEEELRACQFALLDSIAIRDRDMWYNYGNISMAGERYRPFLVDSNIKEFRQIMMDGENALYNMSTTNRGELKEYPLKLVREKTAEDYAKIVLDTVSQTFVDDSIKDPVKRALKAVLSKVIGD